MSLAPGGGPDGPDPDDYLMAAVLRARSGGRIVVRVDPRVGTIAIDGTASLDAVELERLGRIILRAARVVTGIGDMRGV